MNITPKLLDLQLSRRVTRLPPGGGGSVGGRELLRADGHPTMTSPAKSVTHSAPPARPCSFGIPEGNASLCL